ncbi:hypothetical protein IMG5_023600 [Ichthyophthirius multifiliis]|uniref:RRM domain-containing protein n=1 Tax=Ichthyophthirius multifiliis TaxID=5932 RepID=G0QKY5_ICHMU|nr:hypothetical protein IMG5_023600 [Ichthyophthirius multifiliis]EGR34136.1 hypothetical protein IMG5_023600 [Ichthyophthirius multifiliis]|eukprot:XP_004039440.1 hypothetical protein IMG5_023600 [Ichthyophthirius multifiliis]
MQIDTEKFYWDGFLWQPKINMQIMDECFLKQTEKQRKIQIDNVPLEYGLDKIDIISYITNYMKEKALANNDNPNPVLNCEINEEDKTANIELSSVPETNLMYKLGKIIFFQNECKISRLGENPDGVNNLKQLTQLARQQAEAQAAVIKATENIMQMKNFEKLTVNKLDKKPKFKVIKVLNCIMQGTENLLTKVQWDDLHADLIEEFSRFGIIIDSFIVRPYQATVGAKCGTFFIEYDNSESACQAMEYNNGRIFNGQKLKIFNIPEDGYNLNFKQLVYIKN